MAKIYRVVIEETISEEFKVTAESTEDAISKAIDLYNSGEFILESGKVEQRQICVVEDSECGDWIQF